MPTRGGGKRAQPDTAGEPEPSSTALVAAKKARGDGALVEGSKAQGTLTVPGGSVPRTSELLAPIMKLTGHAGEVLSGRFSPCGQFLASAGYDKDVLLWEVLGECRNFCVLKGHHKAVLQLAWSADSAQLYSCSADKSLISWDAEYGERIVRMTGHASHVNALSVSRKSRGMLASGSDDSTCRIWDARLRYAVQTLPQPYQCTAVELSDDGTRLFAGGLDNVVRVHDLRKGDGAESVVFRLEGHMDTITGLRLSPDDSHLLTNSMDNTVRTWDVRPFVLSESRQSKVFLGAQHNFEKNLLRCAWSPDGSRVTAGSSDWFVYVWDVASGKIRYKLPGHRGCVNEVDFHPSQPIVLSCSSDKTIYLGEIESSTSG
mmetsp:Transcript_11351/g.33653  ORF Transcript_11351/g.33653 Transcript_11351/m.33653 type:complete len:373 (-) Transcript_11351:69-1187(-)